MDGYRHGRRPAAQRVRDGTQCSQSGPSRLPACRDRDQAHRPTFKIDAPILGHVLHIVQRIFDEARNSAMIARRADDDPIGTAQGIDQRSGLRDRKSVVEGTSVSVRVDLGGRRIIKKKKPMLGSKSSYTSYKYKLSI